VKLEQLKNIWERSDPTEFSLEHAYPLLIGCGIAPTQLLHDDGRETHFVEPVRADQPLRHSHALFGRLFPIRGTGHGRISVGRGSDNDVVVPDYPISKRHCYFEKQGTFWVVVDLGSANGTFVNYARLREGHPQRLAHRDEIVLGRFSFRFFASVRQLMEDPDPIAGFGAAVA